MFVFACMYVCVCVCASFSFSFKLKRRVNYTVETLKAMNHKLSVPFPCLCPLCMCVCVLGSVPPTLFHTETKKQRDSKKQRELRDKHTQAKHGDAEKHEYDNHSKKQNLPPNTHKLNCMCFPYLCVVVARVCVCMCGPSLSVSFSYAKTKRQKDREKPRHTQSKDNHPCISPLNVSLCMCV